MAIFTGSGVAIVTPFNEIGEIDYNQFDKLIDYQVDNGTDAIIVCGTTGEASTLSHEEHISVIERAVARVNKRIPVVAGTGSNCTDTAIYLSKEAERIGVDGLLIVTPYYNKCTQRGLYEHYKLIAAETKLPIILYNIPGRTGGVVILPETVAKLVREVDNIVGVKDATGNIAQIIHMMTLCGVDNVDLYAGNDNEIIPVLAVGGKGVISVLANIAPRETSELCNKFFEGDIGAARDMQFKATELVDALFCEVNPIPVKRALAYMGMGCKTLRRPLTVMDDINATRLKKAMEEYGLL